MDVQDVIALALAAAAMVAVGRALLKTLRGQAGCRCGQAPSRTGPARSPDRTGLKRRPVVTPDGVGRVYPSHRDDPAG